MKSQLAPKSPMGHTLGTPCLFSTENASELAKLKRYQFQWWVLSLIDARPYSDKKKGADTGIDGYVYFVDAKLLNPYKKAERVRAVVKEEELELGRD